MVGGTQKSWLNLQPDALGVTILELMKAEKFTSD